MLWTLLLTFFCNGQAALPIAHQDLSYLTDAELSGLVHGLAAVLSAVERHELPPPQDKTEIDCTVAGWFFKSSGRCTTLVGREDCTENRVRCAGWTGGKACVDRQTSPLAACLKEGDAATLGSFYRSPLTSGDWFRITNYVGAVCRKNSQSGACRSHALTTKELLPKIESRRRGRAERPRRKTFGFFELLFGESAHAEEPCTKNPADDTFTMMNGKKLHFMMARHQNPGQGGNGFIWDYLDANPKATKADIENKFKNLLENQKDLLRRFDQDRDQVRKLSEEGKIKWVGVEMLPTGFQRSQLAQWNSFDANLGAQLKKKGVDPALFDQMRAYYWGPITDDYLANAKWTQKLELIGFDSDFIKKWNRSFEEANAIANQNFNDEKTLSKENYDKIMKLADRLEDADELPSREEIMKTVFTLPAGLRDQITTYLMKLKQAREISLVRDTLAADRLLAKNEDGLIIMGAAHKNHLLQELTRRCVENAENTRTHSAESAQ